MSDLPLLEDDRAEPGLLEAHMVHRPLEGLPGAATLCFFNDLLERLAAEGALEPVYTLRSEIGANPVYRASTPRGEVCVVHPGVGAPLAAAFTEELGALGVSTFVACGGAGALVDLELGHVMVVDSAVRDEGTSFHYAAPGRVIEADPRGVGALTATLDELGVPHEVGRTWTTDALYREARTRVERRRAEGCAMVDMESSALIAVTRYRGWRFAQLLYAGDALSGADWDSRHWDRAHDVRERLFWAAATTAAGWQGE